jgi:DNA replication protein DnaC
MTDTIYPAAFTADPDNTILIKFKEDPLCKCKNCADRRLMFAFMVDAGPFDDRPQFAPKGKVYKVCDMKAFYLETNCGLYGVDLNLRIEQFRPMPGKEKARKAALRYMEQGPQGFVTLWGEFGTGKSMLLKILVNQFRVQGHHSTYINTPDMLGRFKRAYSDTEVATEDLIDEYKNVRMLALDELDKVRWTAWDKETMQRLLDERYNRREGRLTIMAMNQKPEQMEQHLGYLKSRMEGGEIVHLAGADVRPALSYPMIGD